MDMDNPNEDPHREEKEPEEQKEPEESEIPTLGQVLAGGATVVNKAIADKVRKLPDLDIVSLVRMAKVGLKMKHDSLTGMLKDLDERRDAYLAARGMVEEEFSRLQKMETPEEEEGKG